MDTTKLRTRDWPLDRLLAEINNSLGKVGVYLSYACEKDDVRNNPELAGSLSMLTSMVLDATAVIETLIPNDEEDE